MRARWACLVSFTAGACAWLACGGQTTSADATGPEAGHGTPPDGSATSPAHDATADAGGPQRDATADALSAEAKVQCGAALSCASGEVCAVYADGGKCFKRGDEPTYTSPGPWPHIVLYCDDDADCSQNERCVGTRGEMVIFKCVEEPPDGASCFSHIEHVCTTNADCHSCMGDKEVHFDCVVRHPEMRPLRTCWYRSE